MRLISGEEIRPGYPLVRPLEILMEATDKWVVMSATPAFWTFKYERLSTNRQFRYSPPLISEEFRNHMDYLESVIDVRSMAFELPVKMLEYWRPFLNNFEYMWEFFSQKFSPEFWEKSPRQDLDWNKIIQKVVLWYCSGIIQAKVWENFIDYGVPADFDLHAPLLESISGENTEGAL